MAASTRTTEESREASAQIREYLAALSPDARRAVKQLQEIVRAAAPRARPAFSYRIPAFAIDGRVLVWCAGWKKHVSLYPVTPAMMQAGGEDITPYRSSKGTLKFDIDSPLPSALIRRLIKARVAEMKK